MLFVSALLMVLTAGAVKILVKRIFQQRDDNSPDTFDRPTDRLPGYGFFAVYAPSVRVRPRPSDRPADSGTVEEGQKGRMYDKQGGGGGRERPTDRRLVVAGEVCEQRAPTPRMEERERASERRARPRGKGKLERPPGGCQLADRLQRRKGEESPELFPLLYPCTRTRRSRLRRYSRRPSP